MTTFKGIVLHDNVQRHRSILPCSQHKCAPIDEDKNVPSLLQKRSSWFLAALTCFSNNIALLLSDWATSGCSEPSIFSLMACDRSYNGPASSYLPWNLPENVQKKCDGGEKREETNARQPRPSLEQQSKRSGCSGPTAFDSDLSRQRAITSPCRTYPEKRRDINGGQERDLKLRAQRQTLTKHPRLFSLLATGGVVRAECLLEFSFAVQIKQYSGRDDSSAKECGPSDKFRNILTAPTWLSPIPPPGC